MQWVGCTCVGNFRRHVLGEGAHPIWAYKRRGGLRQLRGGVLLRVEPAHRHAPWLHHALRAPPRHVLCTWWLWLLDKSSMPMQRNLRGWSCVVHYKVLGCVVKLQHVLWGRHAVVGWASAQRVVEGAASGSPTPHAVLACVKDGASNLVRGQLMRAGKSSKAPANDGHVRVVGERG